MVEKKNIILGALVIAGGAYLITKPKEEEVVFGAGGNSGGIDLNELGFEESGLSKKQLSTISDILNTTGGETTIDTYNVNGVGASILTTSVQNEKSFTSKSAIDSLAGANVLVSYYGGGDSKKVVGGSDFKNLQSVTAERASSSSADVASFVSGATANLKKQNKSNYTPAKNYSSVDDDKKKKTIGSILRVK